MSTIFLSEEKNVSNNIIWVYLKNLKVIAENFKVKHKKVIVMTKIFLITKI